MTFRAMGTDVLLLTPATDAASARAMERAKEEMQRLEDMLTRFKPNSALSHLNQHPGQWLDVPPELCEVVNLAKCAFASTQGLFNPCVGPVLERLGYDVSFDEIEHAPDDHPVYLVPFMPNLHCPFDVRTDTGQAFLEPGNKIDLGGIGKGYIVKQASRCLMKMGVSQFLCNAGGDLICKGSNGNVPWAVGITDPFDEHRHVMVIDVQDLAVATSGTYRRQWMRCGERVHHLIDPFLGAPAATDMISCTVVHSDLVEAEIQAKAAILLGVDLAIPWLQEQGCAAWVIVKQSGEVVHSCNL